MPRKFLVFILALLALALVVGFVFVGSGATKNTVPVREEGVPATAK